MINPFKEVNWNPDIKGRRRFAVSLIIGFPIIASIWLLVGKLTTGSWALEPAFWVGGVGATVGVVLQAIPAIAKPFYLAWYGIACSIGMVISNVLLVSFYLVVVTSFGILRRTFGSQPVRKAFTKECATYWLDAEKVSDPKRYYRQF